MKMSQADRRGLLIFAGVGLFVLGVLVTVIYQWYFRPYVGPDNCIYTDKHLGQLAPTDQAILLIDQSEVLTQGHIRGVIRKVEEFILDDVRFPTGSRVLIFTFSKDDFPDRGGSAPSFRPTVDLCKPKPEGNPLSENNRKLRERFLRTFMEPLRRNLEQELNKDVGERSPILETLQMIARSQDVGAWNKRKTLIVISDLLQHTQGFSHYRSPSSYEHFQKIYADQVRADFSSWDVVLMYLRRYKDRNLQLSSHLEFWQRYFSDTGGALIRVEGFD